MRRFVHSMSGNPLLAAACGAALVMGAGPALADRVPTVEELWAVIQAQQKEIQALRAKLAETEQKVEATAEMMEHGAAVAAPGEGAGAPVRAAHEEVGGHQPFHHGRSGRTTVGGYGEMHYRRLDGDGGASDLREMDFHRFILFLNHEFDERTRFASELEVEHGYVEPDGGGEVALEYAYLERDVGERLSWRAGMMLVPVGIINETHEPPAFYGVERPEVETYILPTTWREGGVQLVWRPRPGWQADVMLHSGFQTDYTNADAAKRYAVRGGRKSVSSAPANDLAFTARVRWTGMPGVELAAAYQRQGDVTQGKDPTAGGANLWTAHAILRKGPLGLRALYARWDLDGSGPASVGADVQRGWYVEPSWRLNGKVGLFARYARWDNQAGSDAVASEKRQWNVGLSWWPHPDVVLKADWQAQDNADGKDRDGLNLGVGYMF